MIMQNWYYLFALVFSICGLLTFDWRHKLAFFYDTRRSSLTIATAMLVFVLWDLLGIGLGIFYNGNSDYTLPFELLPNLPVEELFFLFLLCYLTLLIYTGGLRGYRHLFKS